MIRIKYDVDEDCGKEIICTKIIIHSVSNNGITIEYENEYGNPDRRNIRLPIEITQTD